VRIAIVGSAHPYKGGSTQHTTELAHRLAAAGHRVSLQSWRSQYPHRLYPGEPLTDEPEVPLFPDTERSLAWNRPEGWWLAGRRLGREFDAIVLTVFTPIQVPAYLAMAKAARSRGCQVVALCHNVLPHESHWFDGPLMRALLRSSDAAFVHSAQQAELAAAFATTPVHVAPLPLHLPHAQWPPEASPGARPARHRLLFFGIVRRYNGLDILIRALTATKPTVSLTVAGEIWADRGGILRLISELQLGDRVTLLDRYIAADEVAAHFCAADALVLPYRSGTASQNALVALRFGLPVIATTAGAIADPVCDGVNGIRCAPGDVADLARGISRLYEPGTLEHLQRGIRPPDTGPAWDRYLATMMLACAGGG
jgi:glycosyltransferase involved in cell wall biosynthesis